MLHRGMERWGHYLLALLCAGVILLSAAWTRDEKKEARHESAASDQSQRLEEAKALATPEPLGKPVSSALLCPYLETPVQDAETGVWKTHPFLEYRLEKDEAILSIAPGTIADCQGTALLMDNGNGIQTLYQGIREITANPGKVLSSGAVLGSGQAGDTLLVTRLQNGRPIPIEAAE